MGQIFDRINRLARSYWNQASDADTQWADTMLQADDEELRNIINELHNKPPSSTVPAEVEHACTVLDLNTNATAMDVKRAYRRLITQWHPDRFVNATPAEQRTAHERAREINAAYIVLNAFYGTR